MTQDPSFIGRPNMKPLAACLSAVFAVGTSFSVAGQGARDAFHGLIASADTSLPTVRARPSSRPTARSAAKSAAGSGHKPSALGVTNCNDDGAGGTLREAVASAMDGDAIDLTTLGCSSITLLLGEIHVNVPSLTINGPGAAYLSIDGNASYGYVNRVFDHTGAGTLGLTGMTITDAYYTGTLAKGGCIYSGGSVNLSASIVSYCGLAASAGSPDYALGGAIYSRNATTLSSSTVTNNVAFAGGNGAYGGGIFTRGGLTTKYSTISNNLVSSADPARSTSGGGVYATGSADVTIITTTLSGNQAESGGGILVGYGSAPSLIINSTISSNAGSVYVGGGVFLTPTTIANSTVVSNVGGSAQYGVGIYASQTLTAQSSIFANNFAGDNGSDVWTVGGTIDGADDLIRFTNSTTPSNTLTACPRLSQLQDNGGPTKTHALLSDSAGIDVGNNALNQSTDQRGSGFSRTFGAGTDMGAVEWQGDLTDNIFTSGFEIQLHCD